MKVLQVTAALDQGGVERGTVEMADYLVSRGVESLVASNGGRLVPVLEDNGSRHLQLPLHRRNPFTLIYCAVKLRRFIRAEGVDLIHARSRAPAWAALWASRLTGTPFVTTFHGTHRIQNRLKRFYNSVMTRGERVIAISRFIQQHIEDNYGVATARIDVAPRGFSPSAFDPEAFNPSDIDRLKQQIGLKPDVPVIALPGRLTRWKGQPLFLDALGRMPECPWQAILIGGAGAKPAYLEELKTRAKQQQIADRVFFVGDQSDIAPFYALSDLIVSASTEPEAFGRVAVEAQAMGKPVIASAHGGSLETVRDGQTGWLFRSGDAADLERALRTALSAETDLRQIGQTAQAWVEQNFTTLKMCQAEYASYQKILHPSAVTKHG